MQLFNPIKTLFTYLYVLLYTPWLITHLIFDITRYIIPSARPSPRWSLHQAVRMRVVRLLLYHWSLTESGDRLNLGQGKEKNRFEVVSPGNPKLYIGICLNSTVQPAQLGLTWTPSRPPPPGLIRTDVIVALHFHGGAFVIGNGRDADTGLLSQSLIRNTGCTHVCTPQYRLSSSRNGHFPAPLQDGITAYLSLIKTKCIPADQIILSGDSAGANLALGLLRYIHEHGEALNIPFPKAVMLWSPWVDVGAAFEQDMRLSPNYQTDYLNKEFGLWGAKTISAYGAVDPTGPYLSPLRHPFSLKTDLPVFVHAGGSEVLCDDIRDFCKRYREHGWQVYLDVSEGCPHDILLLGSRIGFGDEAAKAADQARVCLSKATGLSLRSYDSRRALW